MQQLQIPEFLKPVMSGLEAMEPSEFLKVTMQLSPQPRTLGEGEPIIAEGVVTFMNIPVLLPTPVVVQVTKRPQTLGIPVAWGLSAPFVGAYRITIPTDGWEHGEYGFQVLALPLIGPPGLSSAKVKEMVEPWYGAGLQVSFAGAQSPLTIDEADMPANIIAGYTLSNTGGRTEDYEVRLDLFGLAWVHNPHLSLAPGASVTSSITGGPYTALGSNYATLTARSHRTTGAHPGTQYASNAELIETYSYGGGLSGVTWGYV